VHWRSVLGVVIDLLRRQTPREPRFPRETHSTKIQDQLNLVKTFSITAHSQQHGMMLTHTLLVLSLLLPSIIARANAANELNEYLDTASPAADREGCLWDVDGKEINRLLSDGQSHSEIIEYELVLMVMVPLQVDQERSSPSAQGPSSSSLPLSYSPRNRNKYQLMGILPMRKIKPF
jgi:hypothetical protein